MEYSSEPNSAIRVMLFRLRRDSWASGVRQLVEKGAVVRFGRFETLAPGHVYVVAGDVVEGVRLLMLDRRAVRHPLHNRIARGDGSMFLSAAGGSRRSGIPVHWDTLNTLKYLSSGIDRASSLEQQGF